MQHFLLKIAEKWFQQNNCSYLVCSPSANTQTQVKNM